MLKAVDRSAVRLQNLIDDVFTLSKLESGAFTTASAGGHRPGHRRRGRRAAALGHRPWADLDQRLPRRRPDRQW